MFMRWFSLLWNCAFSLQSNSSLSVEEELSHLLGIIPELLLVNGSTLGSLTRPYPFPVAGNSYDRVLLSWSYMVEVHGGQNNGPIRRWMALV